MYLQVGKIINTHGIKGAVKVIPFTYDLDRFNEYNYVFLGEEKEKLHISSVSFYKGVVILSFEEFDNINQIEKYKGENLYIEEAQIKKLEDDTFYIYELLNSDVFDLENNFLGKLISVEEGASNDVYVIDHFGVEVRIPAVKEFIKKVDTKNNKLIVSPIRGMFDEN